MSTMSFDIEGLRAAAARYEEAAAQAQAAGSGLAALSFDASALGGTVSAQTLGGALQGFGANHASVASANAGALRGFAARLRAVSGLGVSAAEESAAAAGYY